MAHSHALARWLLVSALAAGGWLSGCGEKGGSAISSGGGGPTTTSTGVTGTGGIPTTGEGQGGSIGIECPSGQVVCGAGPQTSCYQGDPGTEGTGSCHAGTQTCDGLGYGVCEGQGLPAPATCASPTVFTCGAAPSCGAPAFQVIPPPQSGTDVFETAVALDAQGNAFAASKTEGVSPSTSLSLAVTKIDPTGNTLWNKTFPSSGPPSNATDYDAMIQSLAVGPDGKVVLVGHLDNVTMSFGGAPLTSTSAFVAALDAAGNPVYSADLSAVAPHFYAISGVTVDGAGNAYLAGQGKDGTATVAKLDPSGNLLWSAGVSGPWYAVGNAVALDGTGNVYLTGASIFSSSLADCANSAVLLASFDAAGALRWKTTFGQPAAGGSGTAIAVGPSGDIFLSGSVDAGLDLGGGVLGGSAFAARFDSTGAHVWSLSVEHMSPSVGFSLDSAGNVVVLTTAGRLLKIRPDGIPFADRVVSPGNGGDAGFYGLAVGAQGNVVITGLYGGTVDFGLGAAPTATNNSFLLALDP